VAVTVEWTLRPAEVTKEAGRVAAGASLVAAEMRIALGEAMAPSMGPRPDVRPHARGAPPAAVAEDPRDGAERIAWRALSADGAPAMERSSVAVGLAMGRDARDEGVSTELARELSVAYARATLAWSQPVVESRTRVERGQGELWVLLASPCGVRSENGDDAGHAAVVMLAASKRLAESAADTEIVAEPWAAQDGVGLLVHGAARSGEAPEVHARRVADAAARALSAEPLSPSVLAIARTEALTRTAGTDVTRGLSALAMALAPGRPSWITPWGSADSVSQATDAGLLARAAALRAGPWRIAVLAPVSASQAAAATGAVDRWIARRAGDAPSCRAAALSHEPTAGLYAVEAPGATREAWIAAPLGESRGEAGDDADEARAAGELLAEAFGGPNALLARALGDAGLARTWGATVLGGPRAPALVLHFATPPGGLDAAVAAVRATIARVRDGGLSAEERAAAIARNDRRKLRDKLDPRGRLIGLWRGEREHAAPPPSLEQLRAFAAARLRDDALVVVAAQAPRGS
jgi:hypothetical protein